MVQQPWFLYVWLSFLSVGPLLPFEDFTSSVCCPLDGLPACRRVSLVVGPPLWCIRTVFLNRRAAARYRALAQIIPGCERPEETTVCYKNSLLYINYQLDALIIIYS